MYFNFECDVSTEEVCGWEYWTKIHEWHGDDSWLKRNESHDAWCGANCYVPGTEILNANTCVKEGKDSLGYVKNKALTD